MKKTHIALSLCLALLILAACAGTASAPEAMPMATQDAALQEQKPMAEFDTFDGVSYIEDYESMAVGASASAPAAPVAPEEGIVVPDFGGRKVIRNASLSIETREFDVHVQHVQDRAAQIGGYVSSSNVSGRKPEVYGDMGRYAYITVRVPQNSMEAYLSDTRGLATVVNESSYSDDITTQYVDTESRLKVLRTQHERILALLAQAARMEDIITLEQELSRLQYEIESLSGQLQYWDDRVDFATVELNLTEIPTGQATAVSTTAFGTRISDGFSNTWNGLATFFEGLLVFLIAGSPVLLLLAVIGVAVFFIIKRVKRKRALPPAE